MSTTFPPTENSGMFMAAAGELEGAGGVILGAPLDDTASFRPGSRFAPAQVRLVSRVLEEYSIYRKRDLREVAFFDAGDLVLPQGSTASSLEIIESAVSYILQRKQKVFLIGGEHTVTLAAVKGCLSVYGEVNVLYIDAHADRRSSYQGVDCSHASVAYHLRQLGRVNLYQFGVRSVAEEEVESLEADRQAYLFSLFEPLREVLPGLPAAPVYVTVDMDVVDPAFAPGVTTPEPGGITSTEILEIFSMLENLKEQVIGFDMVEICPPCDPSQATAVLGAKIIREALLAFL